MKTEIKDILKTSISSTILSGILLALFSIVFVKISFFNPFKEALVDFDFLDVYYSKNFEQNKLINSDIIIINIEDCDRGKIAQILKKVSNSKPKVIGFDVIFKDLKEPESDFLLAQNLTKNNIVLASSLENKKFIKSHEVFSNNSGFTNFNFNDDTNVIRNFKGIFQLNNKNHYSFSSLIARMYLSDSLWNEKKYDDKLSYEQRINFIGNLDKFIIYNYDDLMKAENLDIMRDKIVLIGYAGKPTGNINDIEDKHFTPLNKETSGKSIPDMYGVIIHANIINMILKDDFFFSVSNLWIGVFTFITMYISTVYFILSNKKSPIRFINLKRNYLIIFSVFFIGLMLWLFSRGVIFKVFPIIIGTLFVSEYYEYYSHYVSYFKNKKLWNFIKAKK